ncbi:MAG: hypothetical protein HQ501_13175 [Rhodospirillales bacterium]|nr:hypothetical protein [Rhodospirillales bacterium]
MMRASLFEVWKLTQRTLEGADVPDGHDREGAFAVQWLSERGFPGVDMFAETKPEMAENWSLTIAGDVELQASGNPLVSFGADVIDFCVAAAETSESGIATVVVRGACGPVFLFPFAARRCLNAGACQLHWTLAKGSEFTAVVAGPETVWIDSPSASSGRAGRDLCDVSTPVNVTITFDREGAALRAGEDAPDGGVMSPDMLKTHRAACLANGVEIAQPLWDRMATAARAVLVPASKQSRELGAGGGNAND